MPTERFDARADFKKQEHEVSRLSGIPLTRKDGKPNGLGQKAIDMAISMNFNGDNPNAPAESPQIDAKQAKALLSVLQAVSPVRPNKFLGVIDYGLEDKQNAAALAAVKGFHFSEADQNHIVRTALCLHSGQAAQQCRK